ncbi:hypothetical protein SK128_009161 [Halocaridina rubra]|uniref:Uncharacterized protein n=1 Tax=Halocaridina rubra TaxID=373956 RepID=A0AAN9A157_HALRR
MEKVQSIPLDLEEHYDILKVDIKREVDGFLRLLYKQEEKCKNFPAQLMEHMDMLVGEKEWQRGGPMKWENWNSDEVNDGLVLSNSRREREHMIDLLIEGLEVVL